MEWVERIRKMVDLANELYFQKEYAESILLYQSIDRLCDKHKVEMPHEGVSLNIELDRMFETDILNDMALSISCLAGRVC
jgi:hypothetical protein